MNLIWEIYTVYNKIAIDLIILYIIFKSAYVMFHILRYKLTLIVYMNFLISGKHVALIIKLS